MEQELLESDCSASGKQFQKQLLDALIFLEIQPHRQCWFAILEPFEFQHFQLSDCFWKRFLEGRDEVQWDRKDFDAFGEERETAADFVLGSIKFLQKWQSPEEIR
jgi:hypothetical protein